AGHLAAELLGRAGREREPLAAIALNADAATVTAIANDYGYAEVFARQVRGLANAGDIVLGISTSGRSENVLRGLRAGHDAGAVEIAERGRGGDPSSEGRSRLVEQLARARVSSPRTRCDDLRCDISAVTPRDRAPRRDRLDASMRAAIALGSVGEGDHVTDM